VINLRFSQRELVDSICLCCEFYKESEERLECGAFKILRILLEERKVKLEDVVLAARRVSEDI
jgi:hypothetical protein